MSEGLLEIRWHGRGGQGAKTAAAMVAEVAIDAGKYAQAAPEYGAEREGAPIRAYTRISDRPIRVHDAIYYPDIVMVLDDTLLVSQSVGSGLSEDGILMVNTSKSPAEVRKLLGLKGGKVYTIDATTIALEEIKRPIPNTVMTGALCKVTRRGGCRAHQGRHRQEAGRQAQRGHAEGQLPRRGTGLRGGTRRKWLT